MRYEVTIAEVPAPHRRREATRGRTDGPYVELGADYSEVEGFIRTHAPDVAGPPREIVLRGPKVSARETRTRIEFPVRRVPMSVPSATS
jgi:effector-binding domain-containing protein